MISTLTHRIVVGRIGILVVVLVTIGYVEGRTEPATLALHSLKSANDAALEETSMASDNDWSTLVWKHIEGLPAFTVSRGGADCVLSGVTALRYLATGESEHVS